MYNRFVDNFASFDFENVGAYDMPLLKLQSFDVSNNLTSFNERKQADGIHFFIDDYQFQRIWNNPAAYIQMLKRYKFVCSPDFSLYTDMPKALQIFNTYKKQWLARYFQEQGINVVSTVSWSDETSFDFCFDGIPEDSCVAVSSVGVWKNPECLAAFKKGYEEMIRRIKPSKILFMGKVPIEYEQDNVIHLNFRCEKFRNEGKCSNAIKYSNVWREGCK